jgi:hypothetical protein
VLWRLPSSAERAWTKMNDAARHAKNKIIGL